MSAAAGRRPARSRSDNPDVAELTLRSWVDTASSSPASLQHGGKACAKAPKLSPSKDGCGSGAFALHKGSSKMSSEAKRVRHLVRVPRSWIDDVPALQNRVSAERFAKEMRTALDGAVRELSDCQAQEDDAGARMEPSCLDLIEGPAEVLRKRFLLRRIAKFSAAYRFIELTSLMLHRAMGEVAISTDDIGTGLGDFELVQVAAVNAMGRDVKRGGGR